VQEYVRVLIAVLAVATWYVPQEYSDPIVLYEGRPTPSAGYWGAISIDQLGGQGKVRLGDEVEVYFVDHPSVPPLVLSIEDAGSLHLYYIEDFPDLPVMLDIHYQAWPVALEGLLSARVRIINRSALWELRMDRSGGNYGKAIH
jgi:hypothetical protein